MRELRAINCPSCGAPLKLKGGGRILSITCEYCKGVVDLNKTDKILSHFKGIEPPTSFFQVGMEGKINSICWKIIGWIVYRDRDWNRWSEFLLFSPYFGYGWLVDESNGKIYFSRRVRDLDIREWARGYHPPKNLNYRGKFFFEDNNPYGVFIDYVEGELTWIAKRGDKLYSWDYKASNGSYINIERSEIEVESYYTFLLNSSKIEESFKLSKNENDSCKDNIEDFLSNTNTDTKKTDGVSSSITNNSTNNLAETKSNLEKFEDDNENYLDDEVPSKFYLAYLLVLLFTCIVVLVSSTSEKRLINSINPTIESFTVTHPTEIVTLSINRLDKSGFNGINIELTYDENGSRKILTLKDNKLQSSKNIPIESITPKTKGIEAKLILTSGKYSIKVNSQDKNNSEIDVTVISSVGNRTYLYIPIFLLGVYFIYLILKYKNRLPAWFVPASILSGVILSFITLSGLYLLFTLGIIGFLTFKYLSWEERL